MEPKVKNKVIDIKGQSTKHAPDQKLVAEMQEKFDKVKTIIDTKEYNVDLTKDQTLYLMNEFYANVAWKGYESYAISETYNSFKGLVKKDEIHGSVKAEIVEAVFHFLKIHESSGFKFAGLFKEICDQFSIPMQEINQDRQNLRDASLEVTAAEQGIPVEDLVAQFQAAQAQQQAQNSPLG